MIRKKKKRIVIIGNSAAGLSALEAFRRKDQNSAIVIIDQEPHLAYSRVITPYFIMGEIKKEGGLFLKTETFYKDLNVNTLFGEKVLSIDVQSRKVVLDDGKKEPFDLLLIATGASPTRPKIEGRIEKDIYVLRSLSDAKQLKKVKGKARNFLFLGAGLVSLQTLQALYTSKGEYTLVVKSDHILSKTLDYEASQIVERHLVKRGIRIIKEKDVVRLKGMNGSKIATLTHGEQIETDLIFAGKGVRPNMDFLDGGGVKIQNGILVNEYMETNEEGIYAAGDVAQAPDFFSAEKVNYGLWPSAVEQGEIVGKNMAGLKEIYSGNLRMNVTQIFSMPIVSIGDFGSMRVSETLIKKDEKNSIYRKICIDQNGALIGAILINRIEDLGIIHGLIRARKNVDLLSKSMWESPTSYVSVYKNIMEGKL